MAVMVARIGFNETHNRTIKSEPKQVMLKPGAVMVNYNNFPVYAEPDVNVITEENY